MIPNYFTSIRLMIHSSPAFTRRFGKKVKAVGGHYERASCYYEGRRFVTLPATALALACDIIAAFPYQATRETTIATVCASLRGYEIVKEAHLSSVPTVESLLAALAPFKPITLAEYDVIRAQEKAAKSAVEKAAYAAEVDGLVALAAGMTSEEVVRALAAVEVPAGISYEILCGGDRPLRPVLHARAAMKVLAAQKEV